MTRGCRRRINQREKGEIGTCRYVPLVKKSLTFPLLKISGNFYHISFEDSERNLIINKILFILD